MPFAWKKHVTFGCSDDDTKTIDEHIRRIRLLENRNPNIRCEPLVIGLQGSPGKGKTILASRLIKTLFKNQTVFSMNALDEFEDGIEDAQVVLIDDFMLVRAGDSPDIPRFIRMCSSAPYRPNFARLELKGMTVAPHVIIITTNQDLDNVNTPYFSSAIWRRFTVVIDFDRDMVIFEGLKHRFNENNIIGDILIAMRNKSVVYSKLVE